MQSDANIIQQVTQGDRNAFEPLVERYKKFVFAIAWSRIGDSVLAEDITQDAFLQAYRHIATLRNPAKFPAWLARITRNLTSAAIRKQARERSSLQQWKLDSIAPVAIADPIPPHTDPDIHATLSTTIANLPDSHRECLVLYYLQGLDQTTCARHLGISEGTFRTRLHRARTSLRSELEQALARDLAQLEPNKHITARVMNVLPAGPLFAHAARIPLAGMLLPLLQLLPAAMLYGELSWFQRGLERNYRHNARERRGVMHSNLLRLILVIVPVLLVSGWITRTYGYQTLYAVLAVSLLPGLYPAARLIRYNRSPFILASILQILIMAAGFALVGFAGFPVYTFFIALLIINILLFLTRKSMPMRNDYNLFFRAAAGELALETPPSQPFPLPTPTNVKSFLFLLGNAFLMVDTRRRGSDTVLYLPPVVPNVWTMLFPCAGRNNSTLTLHPDGSCLARLTEQDHRGLKTLFPEADLSPAALEQQVSLAAQFAWNHTAQGSPEEGLRALQPLDDSILFKAPPHQLKCFRVIFILAIVCALLCGVMLMVAHSFGAFQ